MSENSRNILNYDEASELLRMNKGTLQWYVHQKKIPHLRLGPRTVRFNKDDLLSWMQSKNIQEPDREKVVNGTLQDALLEINRMIVTHGRTAKVEATIRIQNQ